MSNIRRNLTTPEGIVGDDNLWKLFKKEMERLDINNVDNELRGTITNLNKLDGVVTRYCCSGHEDRSGRFYILMVVRNVEAMRTIKNLVYRINLEMSRNQELYGMGPGSGKFYYLNLSQVTMAVKGTILYNGLKTSITSNHRTLDKEIYRLIEKTVSEFLNIQNHLSDRPNNRFI